ncbi:substrate-binding domain-containing protein [Vibrio parahaemolyticus]|nr:substrate-binding domain-containing protein [Vibrio parahaemolyticus]EGQ8182977.1 substrate-binding domain-containing protein [Vibrio parahaemolyticus]EGQ8544796.1 substrate-binding domain-containing protein [Vibrio parahaemolyticus]EKQ5821994.1 substrate-binding domain-containing protein [Vibrio parahaemolyticus]
MKSVTLKNLFNKGLIATSIIVASSLAATVQANERIAFFVSDLSNVFHQSQATEAKRYAKEKYGAEVVIFDGKADSAVMTQNVDQVAAGAFDGASLHIWDGEAATPGVMEALEENIAMTSFFSPITDTGIPTARSDEATVSFDMGAQMAKEWMAANPNKPIVMVQLGWPNHTEVTSGRTNPFAQGVLSVAPNAKNLGALDASGGQEAAKQIIVDLLTQQPEVNLIYSEASNLTVGTMAGLKQLGRGKFKNGKPVTEIVASVDFDSVEFGQIYDPESSLKVSMGLPPIETARGRIDLVMDVINKKVAPRSDEAQEFFYDAYTISYWSMPKPDAEQWLKNQFSN